MKECDDCHPQMCLRCAHLNDGSASADLEQYCTQTEAMAEQEAVHRERAEGHGVDFQICPNENCNRPVVLGDGCVSLIDVAPA
jgi:hypothetical protein